MTRLIAKANPRAQKSQTTHIAPISPASNKYTWGTVGPNLIFNMKTMYYQSPLIVYPQCQFTYMMLQDVAVCPSGLIELVGPADLDAESSFGDQPI